MGLRCYIQHILDPIIKHPQKSKKDSYFLMFTKSKMNAGNFSSALKQTQTLKAQNLMLSTFHYTKAL